MTDIYIRDLQGFKIEYDDVKTEFKATKGSVIIKADTEEFLAALIRQHLKDEKKFKPIEAIKVDDGIRGRITSRVADNKNMVYFSVKGSDRTPASHTQEVLMGYEWDRAEAKKSKFVEATSKNLLILGDIEKEKEAIAACERAVEILKKKFEKPVTWETIDKAAGEEA